MTDKTEVQMIEAAAADIEQQIANLTQEEIDGLENNWDDDGIPYTAKIEIDESGAVTDIIVTVGHGDGIWLNVAGPFAEAIETAVELARDEAERVAEEKAMLACLDY